MDAWEQRWAAYDEATYDFVLAQLREDDVVLDIGAGDLRLARRMAGRVRKVYAIEIQAALVNDGDDLIGGEPDHLAVVCADARTLPFPAGITLAVLLMRHCRQVGLYWDKLKVAGCQRLITNARWRVGVERVDLTAWRRPYSQVAMGWFACSCGATGFIPGPPEQLTLTVLNTVQEVSVCPECKQHTSLDTNLTNEHELVRK